MTRGSQKSSFLNLKIVIHTFTFYTTCIKYLVYRQSILDYCAKTNKCHIQYSTRIFALFGDCSSRYSNGIDCAYMYAQTVTNKEKNFSTWHRSNRAKSLGLIAEKCSVLNATMCKGKTTREKLWNSAAVDINLCVFVYFTEKLSKSPIHQDIIVQLLLCALYFYQKTHPSWIEWKTLAFHIWSSTYDIHT